MSTLSIERPTGTKNSAASIALNVNTLNNNSNPFSTLNPFAVPVGPAQPLTNPLQRAPLFETKSAIPNTPSVSLSINPQQPHQQQQPHPQQQGSNFQLESLFSSSSSSSSSSPYQQSTLGVKRRFESLRLSPCDEKSSPVSAEDSSPEPLPRGRGRTNTNTNTNTNNFNNTNNTALGAGANRQYSYKRNKVLSSLSSSSSSPSSSPVARSTPQEESPFQPCTSARELDSLLESQEKKKFTLDQVKSLLSEALAEQEQRIREEYDQTLHRLLREQFENFSTFNQDYVSRLINQSDFSYLS